MFGYKYRPFCTHCSAFHWAGTCGSRKDDPARGLIMLAMIGVIVGEALKTKK